MANKNLEVEITEGKYNPGGFFSFSYIDFEIETQPYDWTVWRRQVDFAKMREYYATVFPQFVIPALVEPKKSDEEGA